MDEREYERYRTFCAAVPTEPMAFERWVKQRYYRDHLQSQLGGGWVNYEAWRSDKTPKKENDELSNLR